ncbi:hypothetical protein HDU85_005475 [Gaertneriomyces sp. JEL0708]|nr:hypothetical protein HDU85_005475 [Gaertneriomyces sp. JEL0708]
MPGTLIDEDQRNIQEAIGSQAEIVASTAARVYSSRDQSWTLTGVGGLVLTRNMRGAFELQLINTMNGHVLWSQDVSSDVKYQKDRPFFHSFVGATSMIGLSFADEGEANEFYDKFDRKASFAPPQPARAASAVPPPAAPPRSYNSPTVPSTGMASSPVQSSLPASPSVDSIKTLTNNDPARSSRIWGGLGGSLRGKSTKKGGKSGKGHGIDKSSISAPTNFQHLSHVGYNPKEGFTAHGIPPEWQAIFAKAGITQEQLAENPKLAKKALKFMEKHNPSAVPAPAPARSAAPPPPAIPASAGSRRAPPPPPTSRRVPPPPPSAASSSSPVSVTTAPPPIIPRSTPATPAGPPPPPPRGQQAPPAPLVFAQASASAPPPPPPPPAPGVAPVPPPAPRPAADTPSAPRSAPIPPGGEGRGDLLASIRAAGGKGALKTVQREESTTPPEQSADGSDDLAAALRSALFARKGKVGGSDSEESDGESDDEGWD